MPNTDVLIDDLKILVHDAEELLRATAGETGAKVQEARARAEASLRAAREHIKNAGAEIDRQVHEHPWTAVGVAAGVGLLIGVLIARK